VQGLRRRAWAARRPPGAVQSVREPTRLPVVPSRSWRVCVCVCVCVCVRPGHHAHRPLGRSIAGARHRCADTRSYRSPNHVGCGLQETCDNQPCDDVPQQHNMRRRYGSPNHVKGDIERMRYVFIGDFVDRPSPPRPSHAHPHGSQRGAARRVRPRVPSRPLRSGSSGCTADAAGSRAALLHDGWSHSGGRVRGCMRLAQLGGDHAAARTQGTDRGSNLQPSPLSPFLPPHAYLVPLTRRGWPRRGRGAHPAGGSPIRMPHCTLARPQRCPICAQPATHACMHQGCNRRGRGCAQVLYPAKVFLVRGNHEDRAVNLL